MHVLAILLIGSVIVVLTFRMGLTIGKASREQEVATLTSRNQMLSTALDFIRAEGEYVADLLSKRIAQAHRPAVIVEEKSAFGLWSRSEHLHIDGYDWHAY